jgi:alpha-tubulin suppressor-like RCC1 family protein
VRLGWLGAAVAAFTLILLSAPPAAAQGPYPPGISAETIRTATLRTAVVAAGGAHSCAVTSLGDLYCWGDDTAGQLGDGAREHGTGRPVHALSGVVQVDAGEAHTCAIDVRGRGYCWGDGFAGQLGDGLRAGRDAPMPLPAPVDKLVEITTGARHTCAVDGAGAAWCWGDGAHGQLGVPGVSGSATPQRVSTASGMRDRVVHIAAGRDTTCAVTAAGAAYCWGSDVYGQLGAATRGERDEPVAVRLPAGMDGTVRGITVGGMQACAAGDGGRSYCWGSADGAPAGAFDEITTGDVHSCGLGSGGRAYCWGAGAGGRLGDGHTVPREAPVRVRVGAVLRDLDAGAEHSCALDTRWRVYCWGARGGGRLGTDTTSPDGWGGDAASVPVRVAGLPEPPAPVTGVRVQPLDGGLRVNWRPSADFGTGEFLYLWVTTADYAATCTLTAATADGCELTGLENGRAARVGVLVRTRDGITIGDLVTGTPAAGAPAPSGAPQPRPVSLAVLPGASGGLPATGLTPVALVALGTLLLGGGFSALLVRRR